MAFSELELKRIEGIVEPFCRRRSPAHARHQVRTEYRVVGHEVLIVEVRTVGRCDEVEEHGVAKLKFNRRAEIILAAGLAQVAGVQAICRESGSGGFGRGGRSGSEWLFFRVNWVGDFGSATVRR